MEETEICYRAAVRLLQYRWRSARELDERLQQKGFDRAVIRDVLERLRQQNWLDDQRFAAEFVRSRRLHHLGRYRIARELEARGVDRAQAAEALKSTGEDEREQLRLACRKRIRVMTRLRGSTFFSGSQGRRKLTAYLLRQGYDYAAVLEVVEEELGK